MPPANLNQTEQRAWEWLVEEKGYDPDEIVRDSPQQSPDFICPDESYEVKRPSSKYKFVVSERQSRIFEEQDPLIVVMHERDDEPQEVFRWSENSNARYSPHTYQNVVQVSVRCSDETYREWNNMMRELSPFEGENKEDAILRILEAYEKEPTLFRPNYR